MGRFRFIHAADIHLGSILHIDGSEDRQELRNICREATYQAFKNLSRMAIELQVRFILISGDLYDSEARSIRANRFFADECRRLDEAGIEVFVTAGNHDPAGEHREIFSLPDNVHIFKADRPEVYCVRDEGGKPLAAVVGQSYQTRQVKVPLHLDYPSPDRGMFRIAMLHTQLEAGKSIYIPASISELINNASFDYWALGHIHKPQILHREKPVIAYAGIPQGRDFGEQSPGGCWLAEVDGTELKDMKYMVASPVVYKSINIDIGCPELSQAASLDQLEDYLYTYAKSMLDKDVSGREDAALLNNSADLFNIEGFVVRWQIGGRGKLHHTLANDRQGSEQELCRYLREMLWNSEPFLWTDSIEIHTASPVTDEVLSRHPMLKELIDQAVRSIKEDGKKRNRFISLLGKAWTTNTDHEGQDNEKLPLDDETLENIIKDASQLLLEGLAEGGED
ncbi:MAG TPA: DNA repair exonuclease [Clostridiales bacterium]|nr:DNA repair exonuclease [Clostridiales bacterium]